MKKNIRNIFVFCLSYLLCFVSTSFAQEGLKSFEGFNLQGYTDEGNVSWELFGDQANIEGDEVEIFNVRANSYIPEQVQLTAKSGHMNKSEGLVRLQDDVVVTSERGTQLIVDSLDWSRKENLVTTEDEILLVDNGVVITGKGVNAQPNFHQAQVEEDVKVRIDTAPESAQSNILMISSDGPMSVNQALKKAKFEDNVVIKQDGKILKADEVDVIFDEDMKTVKTMTCIGNVEIIEGENKTYAQMAVYDAQTKKLELSGQPKLILFTEGKDVFTAP